MLASPPLHLPRLASLPPRLPPAMARALHGPGRPQEHSPTPQYPPLSGSPSHRPSRSVTDPKAFMAGLRTVEEKQFQLNRPKYYGWYSFLLGQDHIPVGASKFLEFATHTHTVSGGLPEYFREPSARVDRLVEEVAPLVEQTILDLALHTQMACDVENDKVPFREAGATQWHNRDHLREKDRSSMVIRGVHQVLHRHLSSSCPHLLDSSQDFDARNEAFWFRGGIGPDKSMIKKREGDRKAKKKYQADRGGLLRAWHSGGIAEDRVDSEGQLRYPLVAEERARAEPFERALQYRGANTVQVRCAEPLPPWVPLEAEVVTTSEVAWAEAAHDPREWSYRAECRHGTNVPGYWPDEANQHGSLLIHHRTNTYDRHMVASEAWRERSMEQLQREANTAKAMLSCFGWLLPQACHLGFSPITEMTYPLATQACLTDGRTWTHYCYQLNSCDLVKAAKEDHTRSNLLWVGEDLQLYDRLEDGRLVGFNPEALAPLVRQYLRAPVAREEVEAPRTVSSVKDNYQRKYFYGIHRDMYANRPRHHEKPEMYMWEKIHLIDHKGSFEKQLGLRRRRWFQMAKVDQHGKQHWHPEFKQYDEERHRYVPKCYREPWQRKWGLGRRYSENAPKVTVPLQEKVSEFQMPDVRYNKAKPLTGYSSENNKEFGPGFS